MPSIDEMERQAKCFQSVYSIPGRYVNDHCFIADSNGNCHLFHIVGPIGKGCYDKGSEISFGHSVSRDMLNWTALDDILAADPELVHERHHLFAPYVIADGGKFFLFYAGVNVEIKQESMCLASSSDLYEWEKHPYNPVFRPSMSWAEHGCSQSLWSCCRDPHVLRHPKYGFILYYVTWIKGMHGQLVAIGAAVSKNLTSWQDAGPVMVRGFASGFSTTSMESPCVVEHGGIYYLFYKHRDETRLVMSDDPLKFSDKEDLWFSIAHAAEVFKFTGNWYMSSCSREMLDLRHERTDRRCGLFLSRLDWSGEIPEIVPFRKVVHERLACL